MTSEDLNKRIKAHAERSDVVSKLTALLVAWEEGIASARWADVRIREAGDAYMEALTEFIDSRAKQAVLSLREPSKVVAPPFGQWPGSVVSEELSGCTKEGAGWGEPHSYEFDPEVILRRRAHDNGLTRCGARRDSERHIA